MFLLKKCNRKSNLLDYISHLSLHKSSVFNFNFKFLTYTYTTPSLLYVYLCFYHVIYNYIENENSSCEPLEYRPALILSETHEFIKGK